MLIAVVKSIRKVNGDCWRKIIMNRSMNVTKNAIILAAGEGRRLLPLTEKIPKCLVEIAGRSILRNTLDALSVHGCQSVRIVRKSVMIKGTGSR